MDVHFVPNNPLTDFLMICNLFLWHYSAFAKAHIYMICQCNVRWSGLEPLSQHLAHRVTPSRREFGTVGLCGSGILRSS